MVSSQHLLALTKEQSERNKLNMKASELYIPKEKRKLRDKLKDDGDFPKAQLPKEKKVEFDVDLMKAQLQQIQEAESATKRRKKKRPKLSDVKQLRRKGSFTDGQIKYNDTSLLYNPLRERKGYTTKQLHTIDKMMAAKRFPMPDPIINVPENFTLYIDSLCIQGYNSDDGAERGANRLANDEENYNIQVQYSEGMAEPGAIGAGATAD